MQIPGGWFSDRFGSRKVLLIVVFCWSVFTALTGMAWSLISMLIIRILFGIAEGSFFPAASKMISETFPPKQRGLPVSFMLSSSGFMTILVPILASVMLTKPTLGWRRMFYLIGAIGIVLVVLYQFLLKSPGKTKEGSKAPRADSKPISFGELFSIPMIWNILIAYYCTYTLVWGLFTWLPSYLVNIRHINMKDLGVFQILPGAVYLLCTLCSGFIIDKLKLGIVKVVAACCTAGTAILLYLMYTTPNIMSFMYYQTVAFLFLGFLIIFIPSFLLKQIPSEIAGSASGLTNFGAQLAGIFTPMILGFIIDASHGSFTAAFWYLIVFACIPVALFLTLRKTTSTATVQQSESI